MKSDHAKELFHIRAARKIEQEQFSTQEMRREQKCGTSGEVAGKAAPSTFLLSPHFSRGPNAKKLFRMVQYFIRLVRERLLRRLSE